MKVKVTYENKSIMLDIPATKVLVVSDKKRELFEKKVERDGRKDKITSESLYIVESNNSEEVVELTMYEELGELVLFYNPVFMIELDGILASHVYATGWSTTVYVADIFDESPQMLEEQYTRHENGFHSITTPRVIFDATKLTKEMLQDLERANTRFRADMGNYTLVICTRVPDELRAEIADFLRAPREAGKDYSEHSLLDKSTEQIAIEVAKKDDTFFLSPYANNADYWKQVALNYAIH